MENVSLFEDRIIRRSRWNFAYSLTVQTNVGSTRSRNADGGHKGIRVL